jgi:hypothetical protein
MQLREKSKEKTKQLRLIGRNKSLPSLSMKTQMLFTFDRDWQHFVLFLFFFCDDDDIA